LASVEVDEDMMPHRGKVQPSRRARKANKTDGADRRTEPMKLYQSFLSKEMRRLRLERPELRGKNHHQQVFKIAAANWADAPTNPKNKSARDGAAAPGSGSGSGSGSSVAEDQTEAEVGGKASGEEATAEVFDDSDHGMPRGDDSPPAWMHAWMMELPDAQPQAVQDPGAAAVRWAVDRQRLRGHVRRDTGMSRRRPLCGRDDR
jgi:hypothetical protein